MELLSDMMFVALMLMGCLAGSMATWSSPEYSTTYDTPDSDSLEGFSTPYNWYDSDDTSFSADQVSYWSPSTSSVYWDSPTSYSSPSSLYLNSASTTSNWPVGPKTIPTIPWKPSTTIPWKPPTIIPWKPPTVIPWKPTTTIPWKPSTTIPWKPSTTISWKPSTTIPWKPSIPRPWKPTLPTIWKPSRPIAPMKSVTYPATPSLWHPSQISSMDTSMNSNAISVPLGGTGSNSGIFTHLNNGGYSAMPKQHSA